MSPHFNPTFYPSYIFIHTIWQNIKNYSEIKYGKNLDVLYHVWVTNYVPLNPRNSLSDFDGFEVHSCNDNNNLYIFTHPKLANNFSGKTLNQLNKKKFFFQNK